MFWWKTLTYCFYTLFEVPTKHHTPVSISGSVCWQVTLSCLCSVDFDTGAHFWQAVYSFDRGGVFQYFPSWGMRLPLFSASGYLPSYPGYSLRIAPYHRYTGGREGKYTDILWYTYWPRWFVFVPWRTHTSTLAWKQQLVSCESNRFLKAKRNIWYFYRMFLFLYHSVIIY